MLKQLSGAAILSFALASFAPALADTEASARSLLPGAEASEPMSPREPLLLAQRRTCRSVSSCREAVILWCGGYRRADGDNDGIPCETVCGSRRQVDEIRREIGC